MPQDDPGGFSADLDRMEQGIRQQLDPALEHFEQVSAAVKTITDHATSALFGSAWSRYSLPVSTPYEETRDLVVDGQQATAQSLHDFRDALVEIIRLYRTADEASAENLRAGLAGLE